ncbi:MAG TPA: ABC transporter ATP-binding protein [Thermoanaerobaculia bacterium]|nr:ABC transporter ATP-binding protein [Thermoanaerobaculia bacterium]
MGVAVEFREVSKVYPGAGSVPALNGVTLSIGAGEFVAVTGPSGCGKSTLLHLAGGIDVASAGSVSVGGRDLAALTDEALTRFRRREVGTVFQFFNLIPALSVQENVELPVALDGGRDGAARARELLARVGLEGRRDAFPYELSGGEMQRVALARALSASPNLLLADEPTGNLDSVSGAAVLDLLAALHAENGVTVVMATHSEDAARRAGRVVRLRDGRLA